ncbi:MAG TPA: hypothetical protein VIA81_03980 [Acidimicrobiia bacterium]
MAEHDIEFEIPARTLLNNDLVVVVRSDSEKLGELRISKGGIDWWPRKAKKPILFSWEQFAARMERG